MCSIGIGLFFSAFMIGLTWLQSRYTEFSPNNSEEFSSASRSVKPGLIAAGIVSAWTWAATLVNTHYLVLWFKDLKLFLSCKVLPLHTSMVSYNNHPQRDMSLTVIGVSGPWWYGCEVLY